MGEREKGGKGRDGKMCEIREEERRNEPRTFQPDRTTSNSNASPRPSSFLALPRTAQRSSSPEEPVRFDTRRSDQFEENENEEERVESVRTHHLLNDIAPHQLLQTSAQDPVDRLLRRETDVLLDIGSVDEGGICEAKRRERSAREGELNKRREGRRDEPMA